MDKFLAALENGLSGNAVRGSADNALADGAPQPGVHISNIEETVRQSADFIKRGFELAGQAMEGVVDAASNKAFEAAAHVAQPVGEQAHAVHGSFSWGGYFQALGILCILLGVLWFGVWAIRRYGKFNFLPRPGSLPKEALVMEAQMPLGPRKGLMVVRFMGRRLLLGVTEQQISLLTEDKVQDERHENDFQGIMEDARNAHSDPSPGAAAR